MFIISLLVLCKIALVLLSYDFNLIIYNINFLLSWFIIKILILTLALLFLTLATLISSDPYVAELKPYFINNKVHTNIEIKSKTSSLSHYNRLSIKKGLGPQIRYFSNDKQIKPKAIYLNPWWVTGFSDGESCFSVSVIKHKEYKLGYRSQALFSICLHKKDTIPLRGIQSFFLGVGTISYNNSNNKVQFTVNNQKELIEVIIPHFLKYPLLTQKQADFIQFKSIVELMINKEHLVKEGFNMVLSLKAAMNTGLSEEIKTNFLYIKSEPRNLIVTKKIPDPNWISGFSCAESCFDVKIIKKPNYKAGYQVQLRFRIFQHGRDKDLLGLLVSYLNCGTIQISCNNSRNDVTYTVTSLKDIVNIIIPLFRENPLQGSKSLDFEDFCEIADLMKNNVHKTEKGVDQIKEIKNKMNTLRATSSPKL
jgi:hypothetical protein